MQLSILGVVFCSCFVFYVISIYIDYKKTLINAIQDMCVEIDMYVCKIICNYVN